MYTFLFQMNPQWPTAFKELLQRCWHEDKNNRPNMTEVEEILADLLQKEQLLSEARENSVFQRIKRIVLCKDDLAAVNGRKRKSIRCMCVRLLAFIVSVAMLIASFAITFSAPQPVSNVSVTSTTHEHSREAIALAVIAVIGLYSCAFSFWHVWPIIPKEFPDDNPANAAELHGMDPAQVPINNDNDGMITNPTTSEQKRRSHSTSSFHGHIDLREVVEDGVGCNVRLEFFDTINIDDSHGKQSGNLATSSSDRICGTYSKSGEILLLNNNELPFPSLHRSAKRSGPHTPPSKSASTTISNGGESGIHISDEFAPSFNPMMQPTFV